MKILAVDTATPSCSVAVTDNGSLLAEITMTGGRSHSTHLMRLIDTVIGLSGLGIADMEGFAVTIGPGSFTGLRIGISCVKGLAMSSGKPVVGVSSLDVLASQAGTGPDQICAMIDARKGEIYWAIYEYDNGILRKKNPDQVSLSDQALNAVQGPCMFIGTGALAYRQHISEILGDRARFAPSFQHSIRASAVAALSTNRFAGNDVDDICALVPCYIRKPDAELNTAFP